MYGRSKRPDRAMIGGRAGTNRYRVLDDGKRRNEKQEDGGKLSSRGGLSVKGFLGRLGRLAQAPGGVLTR